MAHYKTVNVHGQYTAPLPSTLGKIAQEYIIDKNLKNGDLLFSNSLTGEQLESQSLGRMLTEVFKKLIGKKIGSTILRKSYVSFKYEQNISLNEKRDLAKSMGHSWQIPTEYYNKIDLKVLTNDD